MAHERLFLIKYPDGTTSEPMDQQAVVRHAETGDITLECFIRSTLVNKWDRASDFEPISDILNKQLIARVEAKNDNWLTYVKARINLRVEDLEATKNGLVKPNTVTIPTADMFVRLLATLTDCLILGFIGVIYYLICAWCFEQKVLSGNNVFYVGFTAYWLTIVIYYIFSIYLAKQTPGQRYWGIYLVKENGEQFWLGRIFFYILFMFPFGLFTPLFVLATKSGKSLQEIFTSTRMVKIVFDESVRNKKK